MLPVRVLSLLALLAPCQAQDPVAHWLDALAELARDDGRHDTFGPTGDRLWATRLAPRPGFVGRFHYLHHTSGLDDPLEVELFGADGAPLVLEPASRIWLPSHDAVRWTMRGAPGARVAAERWITADDVLVSRFRVSGLASVGVRMHSPFADRPLGDPGRFTVVSLARLANEDLVRSTRLRVGDPLGPVWLEAESFARQVGSRGRDGKAAASGGEVLGSDFGGTAGHEVAYRFLATGDGEWTLRARFARDLAGDAEWRVAVDGEAAGVLRCPSTGGWGAREEDFAWARLDLGALEAGVRELVLTAAADGANTNFDGFFLVPTASAEAAPPVRSKWRELHPMRGALEVAGGRAVLGGVPFDLLPPMGAQGVFSPDEPIRVGGEGASLHVLAIPIGPDASLSAGSDRVRPGPRRRELRDAVVSLAVPPREDLQLRASDCIVLAVTRERSEPGAAGRRGRLVLHGVGTEVRAGLHGIEERRSVQVPAGGELTFHATWELSGPRVPGVATRRALAPSDTLAAHRHAYASWFAENAPRLRAADTLLQRLWTYRWFLVRHNLARPGVGNLAAGPVVYEGRHGMWYPRVITFSTPHIVAETRWLTDPRVWQGNVRALLSAQQENGVLPNLLVGWRGFRYTHWIPDAVVDAFKVHPDPALMTELLPGLVRNVEGLVAEFDPDGDGLLVPGDHYATGMEFQPSFWAHQGYDDTREQTELERPDFNSYVYGSARGLALASRTVGAEEQASRMDALAERLRAAVMAKLWHEEDQFFYSVRAADGDPARCKEIVGFYPFRFGLPPDEPDVTAALRALVDPEQFWSRFPVATCSRKVPVYSPHVRTWPGPGGKVTACMWNGPVWPHANSLVADAMAVVLRHYRQEAVAPEHLAHLLQRYALFHCEEGDPRRLLLREYGDGESGANEGCPDYMHSTWNDLVVRHVLGLVPRFDDVLEVRPLPLSLGDIAVEDLPYHGRRLGIALRGDTVRVTVDGELAGEAPLAQGLVLEGVLR